MVMVENNRLVYQALAANVAKLRLDNVALHWADGLEFARAAAGCYDVVFLDPPFRSDYLPKVLPLLAPMLNDGARVYVESGTIFELPHGWRVLKNGRAGQVNYQLLERDD